MDRLGWALAFAEGRMIVPSDLIYLRRTRDKGYGVYARQPIPARTKIEEFPVLVVPATDMFNPHGTSLLAQYAFSWSAGKVAIALGYGSLYNHSYNPNARYDDIRPRKKVITAVRDIEPDEEITINYNGDPDDPGPVGFDVIE